MILAIVEFGAWSSVVHHEYILKISSCHLEGGALSMVNKCFESVVDGWVKRVWLSRTKGGGGKIGGAIEAV